MHPPRQPWDEGWLEVGDGHAIFWEQSGHPGAPAALFLHGGPGAASTPHDRRWFHPQQWRTVLFDQRGCGRSRADNLLRANTTDHLVADIEALRRHLGAPDWLLFGGSWGATLALAYAQAHPQRVRGLVLRGVFLATPAESAWLYGAHGAARHRPAAWQRLTAAAGVSSGTAGGAALLNALHERLKAPGEVAQTTAQAWAQWELALMDAEAPAGGAASPASDDEQVLRAARIAVHYARAVWFLPDGALLSQAHRLHTLPASLVQGALDLVTPPASARALHAAWPRSQLHELPASGHASSHPDTAACLVAATQDMAVPASSARLP